jgi:hypothetical protein
MNEYMVQIPFHVPQLKMLAGFSFGSEDAAVDTLSLFFDKKGIDYRIRRTGYGKAFVSTKYGELASVVCCLD